MKKSFLTKLTSVMLSVLMIFSICACDGNSQSANYPKNGARKIIDTEKIFYVSLEMNQPLSVAHYENQEEILLMEINSAVTEFINEMALGRYDGTSVEVEETDSMVKLTRENGAYCEIDFVKDTVLFSDFDTFNKKGDAINPHDMLSSAYLNEEGENIFIKREKSFFTPGYSIEIDLAERDIPLDIYGGKKYIPLQTFNDLFISPYGINIAYNGQALFLLVGNTLSADLEDMYYLDEPTPRTSALAEFNYNELCLALDLYYGLQGEHGFNNGFSDYLEKIGLKEELLKPDAIHAFNALSTLTLGYIADGHSGVVGASPYLGARQPQSGASVEIAPEIIEKIENGEMYKSAREEQLGEVEFYQKVGNTAYVTFDEFTLGDRSAGYENALQVGDTLTIIMAAHAQISQDEEIENVVVDLSCNGGGAVDSAIYLTAWMLGSCNFSTYNSITESKATTTYAVDVNLDGEFDEKDTITDKNLYCIVSPVSFSCGNYVPALLKASGRVTILGKTSNGGGCVVRPAILADGTLFSMSSAYQMSIVKNGSYYGVDQGVEPHIYLKNYENFYNRTALTEYINDLK